LLLERYGEPALVDPAWSEVLASQLGHRSVRRYRPDPVPEAVLEAAVAAAQSAPTSSNLQLWSVIAITDASRKARLADLAGGQDHIRQAPLFLVWTADLSRADRILKVRGAGPGNLDYLDAFLTAAIDASLAAQNAVVTLEALGFGIVYIGAMRNHPEKVASELDLPPLVAPLFGLAVGRPHPDQSASVKPPLPQSVVVHRETYSTDGEFEAFGRYDSVLADFQRAQGQSPVGWRPVVADRAGSPEALHGRERLRGALLALGFPLK
jgi:nitroreductase